MPKLTKQEFAELVRSMPGASEEEILQKAREKEAEKYSILDKFRQPLTDAPSRFARQISESLGDAEAASEGVDQFATGMLGAVPLIGPALSHLAGGEGAAARIKGFAQGAIEGAGDVLTQMTSPLDLALTLTGAAGPAAARRGLTGVSQAARSAERALTAPLVAEGAINTAQGIAEGDLGRAGAGVIQALLGGASLRGGAARPSSQAARADAPQVQTASAAPGPTRLAAQEPSVSSGLAASEGASSSQISTPAQVAEEMLKFEHRSSTPGISELDPSRYGSAQAGREMARKRAYPDEFVDRTFGTITGGEVEARFKSAPFVYEGEVPAAAIYDLSADPQGFRTQALEQAPDDPIRAITLAERAIRDAGFKGYRVPTHESKAMADSIVLFDKVPVRLRAPEGFTNPELFMDPQRSPLVAGDEFGILTWANPQGQALSPEQNAQLMTKLEQELRSRGLNPIAQMGKFGSEEPSFLVPGMTPELVKELGRKGNQVSVISREGYHRLADDATFPSNNIAFNQAAEDNFSEITFPDGRKVKYQMDFPEEAFAEPQQATGTEGVANLKSLALTGKGQEALEIQFDRPIPKKQLESFLKPLAGEGAEPYIAGFGSPHETDHWSVIFMNDKGLVPGRAREVAQQLGGATLVGGTNFANEKAAGLAMEAAEGYRSPSRMQAVQREAQELIQQKKGEKKLSDGTTAFAMAAPAAAMAIPDDPESKWDDFGRIGLGIAGTAGLGAAVRMKPLTGQKLFATRGAGLMLAGTPKKAWADRMIQAGVPQDQLEHIRRASEKLIEKEVNKVGKQLTSAKKLMSTFHSGKSEMTWYDDTYKELQELFGKDADIVAGFLTATSINSTVKSNTTLALKAYKQWKAGEEFHGFLPAVKKELERVANGQPLAGRKLDNFRKAIVGDPDAVVVDRWILRAFGIDAKTATPHQYDLIENAIRELAQRAGVTPRQMQAAIWFGVKNAAEAGKNRPQSPPFQAVLREKMQQPALF